ncbi:MAG TPA: hypothetical protein VEQ63_14975 [Bryobacteraceae bacterium]|nr:hypothetical protein [Bryobacteraceae bacterium]
MRLLLAGSLSCIALTAALSTMYVDQRLDYKNGASFANAGPYEQIRATATLADGATAKVEMLKPRDPSKGNGTLFYATAPGPTEQSLLEAGFTVLRIEGNPPAAIRDVVAFLRYGGQNHLLGDQSRFLKRFIAFGPGDNAKTFAFMVKEGMAKDEKNRKLFDAFWLHDTEAAFEPEPGTTIQVTRGKPLDALALQVNEKVTKGQ